MSYEGFMKGKKLRWSPVQGIGLKLHLMDFMEAAKSHPECHMFQYDAEGTLQQFITFEEAATLICEWFKEKKQAANQILMLRNMLRRCAKKECILICENKNNPTKRQMEEFSKAQMTPIAKKECTIYQFVDEYHSKHNGKCTYHLSIINATYMCICHMC